ELADSRQVLIQKAALDGFINGHLGNRGGVQVSRLFDLNKLGDDRPWRDDITQAQPWSQHFGECTQTDDGRPDLAAQLEQPWQGLTGITQLTIRIVLNDGQLQRSAALYQLLATLKIQGHPGRVLEIG